uniref:Uncharacterized protein n=1 Tax=Oryza punctata TaxID=4537 RepID=A0A0E0M105_ORYPU
MRLPKSEVARLMKDSKDAAEAAEKIMQLCVARDQGGAGAAVTPASLASGPVSAMSGRKTSAMKKEKRTSKRNCRGLEHEKPLLHGFLSLPYNP